MIQKYIDEFEIKFGEKGVPYFLGGTPMKIKEDSYFQIKDWLKTTLEAVERESKEEVINDLPKHCFGCKNGGDSRCTGLHYPDLIKSLTKDQND